MQEPATVRELLQAIVDMLVAETERDGEAWYRKSQGASCVYSLSSRS